MSLIRKFDPGDVTKAVYVTSEVPVDMLGSAFLVLAEEEVVTDTGYPDHPGRQCVLRALRFNDEKAFVETVKAVFPFLNNDERGRVWFFRGVITKPNLTVEFS